MKTKKIEKSLQLTKKTVANLQDAEMNVRAGGFPPTLLCVSKAVFATCDTQLDCSAPC